MTEDSKYQSKWYGCRAAKWKALQAFAAAPENAFLSETLRGLICSPERSTSFYKAVLEWALCEELYEQWSALKYPILKINYSDLVHSTDQVAAEIKDFCGLELSQAVAQKLIFTKSSD